MHLNFHKVLIQMAGCISFKCLSLGWMRQCFPPIKPFGRLGILRKAYGRLWEPGYTI